MQTKVSKNARKDAIASLRKLKGSFILASINEEGVLELFVDGNLTVCMGLVKVLDLSMSKHYARSASDPVVPNPAHKSNNMMVR